MGPTDTRTISAAAAALAALLKKGGPVAREIRIHFCRSTLHRWRTGRQLPDIGSATLLHVLTRGRVAATRWVGSPLVTGLDAAQAVEAAP